jgi:hypothetical protein
MDKISLQLLSNVNDAYSVIEAFHIDQSSKQKIVLGEKHFVCRFCGDSFPKVKFKSHAHAIPEFTGNKILFTNYECDSCNAKFSELETEMSNFMHQLHTVFSVNGKNGLSKFKLFDGLEIKTNGNQIEFDKIDNKDLEYNADLKKIEITQKIPSFVPIAIYKCLSKMALSIMPSYELKYFEDTIRWVNNIKHDTIKFKNLWLIFSTFASQYRFPYVSTILCRKKQIGDLGKPYMLFRLAYANFTFQIYLPLCSLDRSMFYDSNKLLYIPHLIDITEGHELSERQYLDFSSHKKMKGNLIKFIVEDLEK